MVILTQTCDLVQGKTRKVALCLATRLSQFEDSNPGFTKKNLSNVKAERQWGLHYLPPIPAITGDDSIIVEFREIHSLAFSYVLKHAMSFEQRWSLDSPWREHFSRAFGELFSRVALP